MTTRRVADLICLCPILMISIVTISHHESRAAESNSSALNKGAIELNLKAGLEPGNRAPAFSAVGLDGETIDLQEVAGESQYILLDFWASWCGPCRAEFPYLRKLHERHKGRGLRIIGICSDTDRATAARAVKEGKLTYPQVFQTEGSQQSVTDLYQVTGLPQTYILDGNLRIVAKGLRGSSLERRIEKLFNRAELAGLKPQDTVVVTVDKAPLKVIDDVLAKLPKGQELSVVKRKGDWIWTFVDQDGRRIKGWINAGLIARTSDHHKPAESDSVAGIPEELTASADPPPQLGKEQNRQTAAPPAPAEPEPADWELENPEEMPQLFEFAGIRDLDSHVNDEAVGEVGRFELTGTAMSCAAISTDGRFVVSGGEDFVIRLWDAETGGEVRHFDGHGAEVLALAFSEDGGRVISGSADASVRLWDVATGKELYRFSGHESDVISVSFVSGGRFATSTGRDKTLRVWKLPANRAARPQPFPIKVIAQRPVVEPLPHPSPDETSPSSRQDERPPQPYDRDLGGMVNLNSAGEIVAVDFRQTNISDTRLKQLQHLKHLEKLYVYGPNVTDLGLESLQGLTRLKHLWLTETSVTDDGLQALAKLDHLESLVLAHCRGVTDGGLVHVKDLSQLKDLWLNGTRVTDRGMKHLSGLKNLETLVLPGTDAITDAGLEHLKGLPKLRDLLFNGAGVSNRGLKLLAKFAGLQYVDAGRTDIGEAGARHFRQQLPNCELAY